MYHRTNGLFHPTAFCFSLNSPICVGVTFVFSSLGRVSDAWPTILPSSVSPNHSISLSLLHSDASTTRIHLPGERILPVHAPHVLFYSEQVPFPVPTQPLFPAHWRKKKTERKPYTNTYFIHTSTLSPTFQKRVRCFVRSQFPTFCRRTSQLEQTSLWSQVRFSCDFVPCEADCGALGDFEEIYGSPDEDNEHIGQWDAIVTCFFIDTVGLYPHLPIVVHLYSYTIDQAKNIVNYLRTFHRALAPGGVWINLGNTPFIRGRFKN